MAQESSECCAEDLNRVLNVVSWSPVHHWDLTLKCACPTRLQNSMYLFARRSHTWMIYGLLAKQTPTEAREHPQLPHWDASWAHLERILGASSANLGRIFSETWTPRRFCSGRLVHCMNCRTSTHTGALGTEKETRHKSHAMGECLKHLARKQKQMGVKSAKTICMLSIGDSPSDQRPGPKERKATTAAILAQGTRHTYTARFRMCSHGRSKTDSRSPKDPKCPVIRLGIPKPTSGHQQVTRSRCPNVGLDISIRLRNDH